MSEPERLGDILKRVLSELEGKMRKDFDSQLSLKIDGVIFLLDFFNPQVAPASMGERPDRSSACTSSGEDNERFITSS
jgi:hypothetical protein